MSRMQTKTAGRRARRRFTSEFKAGAVRLVLGRGQDVGAVARELDLTASALGELGGAGAGGSHEGQDRPDDRGAGGAGATSQGGPRAADGARHPKKSRGLLREEPSVRFACIEAEKAVFPITKAVRCLRVSPSGFYAWRGAARVAHARETTGGCGCWSGRRTTRAGSATAARGSTGI